MRRWLSSALVVSFAFGCTPDGARERREAWSAFVAVEEQAREHWAAWALASSVSEPADLALYYASRAEGLESSAEEVVDTAGEMVRAFSECRDLGLPLDQCDAWQETEAREDARRKAEDAPRRMAFPDAWEARRAARAAMFAAQERVHVLLPLLIETASTPAQRGGAPAGIEGHAAVVALFRLQYTFCRIHNPSVAPQRWRRVWMRSSGISSG